MYLFFFNSTLHTVCGAWREPELGWIDNLFAYTGVVAAVGKGILRSTLVKKGINMDFIPVDTCANLMIVSAYNNCVRKYQ